MKLFSKAFLMAWSLLAGLSNGAIAARGPCRPVFGEASFAVHGNGMEPRMNTDDR